MTYRYCDTGGLLPGHRCLGRAENVEQYPKNNTEYMDLKLKPNSSIQVEGARAPDTGLQAPAQAKEVTASDTGRTQAEGANVPDTGSHTPMEVAHTTDVESGSSVRGHQDSDTPDPSAAEFQLDKAARKRAKRQRQQAQKRLESLAIQPRSARTAETAEKGEDAV